jgi:hypothetical protein
VDDAGTEPWPRLRTTWPVFAEELTAALVADGSRELAAQVDHLRVVARCNCGDDFCQSFYTAPRPEGTYGPDLVNVMLEAPWPGELVLDIVQGQIMHVEVLFRPPLT